MPETIKAKITKIIPLAPLAKAVYILPERKINFQPGQFLMLELELQQRKDFKLKKNAPAKQKRAFSISSSPSNDEIEFTIKQTKKSPFVSRYFTDYIQVGETIQISQPMGKFIFDETSPYSLFLAAGSGIASFMSMLRYAEEKKLSNTITLIYSNKTEKDILWKNELKNLTKNNQNIKVQFTLTHEKNAKYLQGRIKKKMLQEYFKSTPKEQTTYYLCGPLPFVKDMREKLLDLGVSSEQTKQEIYN